VLITTHMIYYYENSFNLANSGKVSWGYPMVYRLHFWNHWSRQSFRKYKQDGSDYDQSTLYMWTQHNETQ
jgi:hypothetical protein